VAVGGVAAGLAVLVARKTARLRLVALRPKDAGALRAITDDRAIARHVHVLACPFTHRAARRLIRGRGDGSDRFIGLWRRGALSGVIGVHFAGADAIEIGYWIARAHQGRGYATEAGAALVALLRRRFPGRRIFAECRPENRASWRVLRKLGFRPTGAPGARPGRQVLALATPIRISES
jgi:RimJ/RimL family protein N-acetyltransferase